MAVMKKKGGKTTPGISTASLPDVIFMILFFFMVSTSMKDQDAKVRVTVPEATEVAKLTNKSLTSYILVGEPIPSLQAQFGTAPRIQLNDSFRSTQDILEFIASERDKLSEIERSQMTVALKADKSTRMGIVTDIKEELRKANALKISYTASKTMGY